MTSPHPKIAAILAALIILITDAKALLDGDPATNPDWVATAAALSLAYGLLRTRQNNVTSEQAGAK